jgi:hypothetical protein
MHTYHDVARLTTGDRAWEISPTIAPKRKPLQPGSASPQWTNGFLSLLSLRIILALLLAASGGSGSTETAMATTPACEHRTLAAPSGSCLRGSTSARRFGR